MRSAHLFWRCAYLFSVGGSNLILNGSLDRGAGVSPTDATGILHIGSVNSTAITDWAITEGTVDLVPTSYWDAPTGMGYSLDMIGTPGTVTTVNSGGTLGGGGGGVNLPTRTDLPAGVHGRGRHLSIDVRHVGQPVDRWRCGV